MRTPIYTIADAVAATGISRTTVYDLVAAHGIGLRTVGGGRDSGRRGRGANHGSITIGGGGAEARRRRTSASTARVCRISSSTMQRGVHPAN